MVTFHRLDDATTRVMLQLEYEPEGMVETTGSALRLVSWRVESDLKRFRDFIEERGSETGAWHGDVPRHNVGQLPRSS